MDQEEAEKLLNQHEGGKDEYLERKRIVVSHGRGVITILIALLLGSNALWIWLIPHVPRGSSDRTRTYCAIASIQTINDLQLIEVVAGTKDLVLTLFHHDWVGIEPVQDNHQRYMQEEWGSKLFPPHGGSVALSKKYVEELGLPSSVPTEGDPNKMHYLVSGYHQLHCASVVRDALYYVNGSLAEWPGEHDFEWNHVLHCVEAVRQALTCFLDPTLIPMTQEWPHFPDTPQHMCRDISAMRAWTETHKHPLPPNVE